MKIEVVTSPYSNGAMTDSGTGPVALLHAGLLEALHAEGHDVGGPYHAVAPARDFPNASGVGDEMAVIEDAGKALAELVRDARRRAAICLVLEGDCTAAPAVVAGLAGEGRVGLLWIDSHGDFNTPETSPSGMIGGMPLAVCTGRCHPLWREAVGLETPIREADVVLAGTRDLDRLERAALDASEVEVTEIASDSFVPGVDYVRAVARLSGQVDTLYVHVDVDVLNPAEASGFNMAVPGGPTAEELAEMVALAMRGGKVAALGIAAFNPTRDSDKRTEHAILHSVEAAIAAVPNGTPTA